MKTVLITGAGRGIGSEFTRRFLAQGDQVIATYRSEAGHKNLQTLASAEQLTCLPLEVTDTHQIDNLARELSGKQIDVLINNAGVIGGKQQTLNNFDFDQWQQTLAINTLAPIKISQALLPNLKHSDHAKIISISSIMASLSRGQPGHYAYRSSKAALNMAMRCLAADIKADDIIAVPVHPGWVQTDMGGQQADMSVKQCVEEFIPFIESLTMQHSGRFWQYDGTELEW